MNYPRFSSLLYGGGYSDAKDEDGSMNQYCVFLLSSNTGRNGSYPFENMDNPVILLIPGKHCYGCLREGICDYWITGDRKTLNEEGGEHSQ